MNEPALIILIHQLLFQGMFFAKNALLRQKLGLPIRGNNREATVSIAFFAVFIGVSLCLAVTATGIARLELLPERTATGICLTLLGVNMVIGAASLRDLGDSWRVGVLTEQQTELVQEGIYRYTRNPYFVSYLLMFAAYTVLLQNLILAALSVVGFWMIHKMIVREERYLTSVHGENYRQYCRHVPRYLLV